MFFDSGKSLGYFVENQLGCTASITDLLGWGANWPTDHDVISATLNRLTGSFDSLLISFSRPGWTSTGRHDLAALPADRPNGSNFMRRADDAVETTRYSEFAQTSYDFGSFRAPPAPLAACGLLDVEA